MVCGLGVDFFLFFRMLSGFMVYGLEFRVEGLGFTVSGFGF
jgi:hypothetical protein